MASAIRCMDGGRVIGLIEWKLVIGRRALITPSAFVESPFQIQQIHEYSPIFEAIPCRTSIENLGRFRRYVAAHSLIHPRRCLRIFAYYEVIWTGLASTVLASPRLRVESHSKVGLVIVENSVFSFCASKDRQPSRRQQHQAPQSVSKVDAITA